MLKLSKTEKRQKSSPTDKVPGGFGQFTNPGDVDAKELEMGQEVEYEHTENSDIAQDIALDHLTEISDYYTRLKKMEEEAKEDGKYTEVKKVCDLLQSLIKIANELDKKGLYVEADQIDHIIEASMSSSHYNNLIKALKDDDLEAAKKTMIRLSPADLRLTEDEYRQLTSHIWKSDLESARELLDIVKGNPDASLGKPVVSPHLKDVFTPDRDRFTVRDIVEGRVKIDEFIKLGK